MLKLSDRLQKMADEVGFLHSACDVGTDHGYLPLYLYGVNPNRRIVMSDVSKGSLERCREDCEKLYPDVSFDLRLGFGLEVLEEGEVDCVVMAGMGGILMIDILSNDLKLTKSFEKFILQPRKHAGRLRKWLLEKGFAITKEMLVRESRFIWPIIVAEPIESGEAGYVSSIEDDMPYLGVSYREAGEAFSDIEYEYPKTLMDFRNECTEDYIKNALKIELKKLESKKNSSSTTARELAAQVHRVQHLSLLMDLL